MQNVATLATDPGIRSFPLMAITRLPFPQVGADPAGKAAPRGGGQTALTVEQAIETL